MWQWHQHIAHPKQLDKGRRKRIDEDEKKMHILSRQQPSFDATRVPDPMLRSKQNEKQTHKEEEEKKASRILLGAPFFFLVQYFMFVMVLFSSPLSMLLYVLVRRRHSLTHNFRCWCLLLPYSTQCHYIRAFVCLLCNRRAITMEWRIDDSLPVCFRALRSEPKSVGISSHSWIEDFLKWKFFLLKSDCIGACGRLINISIESLIRRTKEEWNSLKQFTSQNMSFDSQCFSPILCSSISVFSFSTHSSSALHDVEHVKE